MLQLPSEESLSRFHLLAICNVDVHAAVSDWLIAAIANDAPATQDPADLAVGAYNPVLAFVVVTPLFQGPPKALHDCLAIFWMTQSTHHGNRSLLCVWIETHKTKELGPTTNRARRKIDVPY